MFETTVKHFVYELCIGLIFDNLKYNFIHSSNEVPKKGDFIKRVSHIHADEHYYDCIVKNVFLKALLF